MRLIDADMLKTNMRFTCSEIMAGTASYHAPLDEIDDAPTVLQWIPVNINTEIFPNDGENVLVVDEDGDYYVAWRSGGRWWELNPYGEDIKDVRAWMPLPPYEDVWNTRAESEKEAREPDE